MAFHFRQFEGSAVVLRDGLGEAKAYPHPCADGFGGEEGLHQMGAVFLGDSWTAIDNIEEQIAVIRCGVVLNQNADLHPALAFSGCVDRVEGVIEQVE